MPTAKINQTSSDSAEVEPIVLRDGKQTRLVFKSQLVKNAHDENKPVRGALLWQRRGASEQEEAWVDEAHLRLTYMTAGSGVKLDLSTDELYLLTQAVRGLYGFYWEHDKQLPHTGEEFELAEYAQAAKTLDNIDEVAAIMGKTGSDGFTKLLQVLSHNERSADLVAAIERLELADLAGITSLAGIGMLRKCWRYGKLTKATTMKLFGKRCSPGIHLCSHNCFHRRLSFFKRRLMSAVKTLPARAASFPTIYCRIK